MTHDPVPQRLSDAERDTAAQMLREHFEAAEFPVLSADEVAAAMQAAWAGADPGAAYVVQPGVGAIPYRFKGVPAAKTADGGSAAVPAHLRGPL